MHETKEKKMKQKNQKKHLLKVVDSMSGMWHYYLSVSGEYSREALCGGKRVMKIENLLRNWGFKGGNVPASYCATCNKMYLELK
jgi:hypothetical protein